jgi:hypothetical protein
VWDTLYKAELQSILLMLKRPDNKGRDMGSQSLEGVKNRGGAQQLYYAADLKVSKKMKEPSLRFRRNSGNRDIRNDDLVLLS